MHGNEVWKIISEWQLYAACGIAAEILLCEANKRLQRKAREHALDQFSNNTKFIDLYPDVKRRNSIVETYFNFSNSFKDSPISIVKKNSLNDNDYVKIYELKKFTKKAKETISGKIEKVKIDKIHIN